MQATDRVGGSSNRRCPFPLRGFMQIEADAKSAESRRYPFLALRFTLFWVSFSVVVFGAAYALCQSGAVSDVHRPLLFVVVGTLLLIACVWQSVGFLLVQL